MTALIEIIDIAGRPHWINPNYVAHIQDTTPGRCTTQLTEGLPTINTDATAEQVADRLRRSN